MAHVSSKSSELHVRKFGRVGAITEAVWNTMSLEVYTKYLEYLEDWYHGRYVSYSATEIFRHFTIRGKLVTDEGLFMALLSTTPRTPESRDTFHEERAERLSSRHTAEARRKRDERQILIQKLRERTQRKLLPKLVRAKQVRREQRARAGMGVYSDDIEPQGFGHFATGALVASGVSVALSLRSVQRSAVKATDSATGLIKTIEGKLTEYAEWAKTVVGNLWIIPAAVLAHYLLREYLHLPVMALIAGAFLAKYFGAEVWEHLKKFFSVEQQDGASFSQIGGLLCTAVCTALLPTRSVAVALGELMKRMSNFDRSSEGFESFFKHAIKYAEKAVNVVLRMFSKEEVQWVCESDRLVDAFLQKVADFEKLSVAHGDQIDIAKLLEVVDVQLEAIGLKTTVRDDRLKRKVDLGLSRLSTLLVPYQGAITAARNFRAEPTFICLYGGSALGKTTLVTKLACAILVRAKLVTPEHALKNLWQKGNTEFWNGYCNQKCLIMDDCFQLKPVKGESDNEYMNVIRMIGNWAYALNFADLESKGKFYFDTPLVIGTTNCACVSNQADVLITQPEAVVRRIKHPYQIWVSAEYQTPEGKLDYIKVEREFAANLKALRDIPTATSNDYMDAYPWHAWYLTRHDFASPQVSGARKEVRDLIDEVVEHIAQTSENHVESVRLLNEFLVGLGRSGQIGEVEAQSGMLNMRSLSQYLWPGTAVATEATCVQEDLVERDSVVDAQVPFYQAYSEAAEKVRAWFAGFARRYPALCLVTTGAATFLFGGLLCRALIAVAAAIANVVRSLFGVSKKGGPRVSTQSNVPAQRGVPTRVHLTHKMQLENGEVNKSHVQNLIYANTYKLVYQLGQPNEASIGQVQFFESNLAVIPNHFITQLEGMPPEHELSFRHPHLEHHFSMPVSEFLRMKRLKVVDRDVCFLAFDKGVRATKKITQFLLSDANYEAAIKAKPSVQLDVALLRRDGTRVHVQQHTLTSGHFTYMSSIESGRYKTDDVLLYTMPTEKGMCGAPLTISDNRYYGGACYLGFHVAGAPGLFQRRGFSAIITAEMVADAKSKLSVISDNFQEDIAERGVSVTQYSAEEESGLLGHDKLIHGSFTAIGRVDKPVALSPNSKLKLSVLGEQEIFGPNPQRPAHMRPFIGPDGRRISPMLEGLRAYSSPLEVRTIPHLDAIVSMATKPFRTATIGSYRGIFTFFEACEGIEGLKIKSISRGTSPGYPYVLDRGVGKKAFFGSGEKFDYTSEECVALRERVSYIIERAREGVRLAHVYVDFLKDETRPHAKVDAGATRIISASPLDYTIAFRQYFGAFMAAMFQHHTISGMCPGINPYSEWWYLAAHMQKHGKKCFDGDFKRFDSSEQPYVHEAILRFVNEWYDDGPDNARVREVLWLDLIHSRHLGGDGLDQSHLYQWNKSLPSGHPFTTATNSLYALITLTGCYAELTGDYLDMWNKVYLGTYGDDNVANVSDDVSTSFNQVTVAEKMATMFGLTYTAGSKTGELVPYTELESCTFLKRAFVRDEIGAGGWVAPLDKASFLYTCYYYKNNKNMREDMRVNLERLLGELAFHGVDDWEEHFRTAKSILEDELNVAPEHSSRDAYRAMMEARVDAWF